jgi:hypothetical protein
MNKSNSSLVQTLLSVGDFSPDQVLNPAGISGLDRKHLTRELEAKGIVRLSVEHTSFRQTLKKVEDVWLLTCANTKY